MKKNNVLIRKMAGSAILGALSVVLTIVSNYIPIGTVTLNLGIVPIALAAILYGPIAGFFVGACNGVTVILGPGMGGFFAINFAATIVVCVLKSGLAGVVASLVYKLVGKKNEEYAIIAASIITPVVNTAIYVVACYLIFTPYVAYLYLIPINFAVEITVEAVLSPSLVYVVRYYGLKTNKKLKSA